MKHILIALISLLTCISSAFAKDASITIDSRITYQHVTGFGGFSPSPTWSYWLNDSDIDKLFGKGDTQLGYTIMRTYIGTNKNFWNAAVANTKRAKKHGAFVFASPWSPPASWKDNKSESNGGALLESHYKDWANWLNDYYLYMKGQGAPIDAVSIQNEPDWKAEYQSCIWTGQQMAKFLKQYGSLIQCKIIAPEAIHFSRNIHEPILNDAAACEQLDILGGHFYGWDGSSYPLAAQKGKEVWMTEFLINERQQNEKKNIDWKTDGFLFAKSVNDAMLANFSAWVHYSLKRYYGCLGDGDYGTTNGQVTKRGYILSHYAKYVSNTTRVRHILNDESGSLSSSAYLSSTGDSIIVMVLNSGSSSFNTTISLPFNTQGGRQIVTTEKVNMKKTTLTYEEETYAPVMQIEPYSVNTYIFKKSSNRNDLPEAEETGTVVFSDNFDYSGASCIPAGWRSKSDDGVREAGNYSLGPRIMSFSPEGAINYAFYFRAGTNSEGSISYGEKTNQRLTLEPGTYTLSFSAVGYKATPIITAQVLRSPSTKVETLKVTTKSSISSNGSSARITSSTDKTIEFTVEEKGNYILKWTIAKSTSGLVEALLGNIKLTKQDVTGVEVIELNDKPIEDNTIYDLSGRRVINPTHGIYIINGKKVMK